ncbi:MAG: DUF1206 domain-containing protein [Sphingobacteriales bacterium]|nr:MAG: DUF1206 domain-containing protein [Sphingobacteriales bacterium]
MPKRLKTLLAATRTTFRCKRWPTTSRAISRRSFPDLNFKERKQLPVQRTLRKVLTLTGCFSTGILYGSIGVIALLSFLKLKNGGADESSFFVLLDSFAFGRVLNWIIILGAVCFIIWRFYEAFGDPYHLGKSGKALLMRTGAAFSSGADAFIALSVLQALFSKDKAPVTGEPEQQRAMAGQLLQTGWGRAFMFAIAVTLLLTALVLLFYGLSQKFTESIRGRDFSKHGRRVMHILAYAGYVARGSILGITGFFFLKSALARNSSYVVNTDKAFDFIGDHVGGWAFILVALGTISYGLYMFVLGLHYDLDGKQRGRPS